MSAASIGKPNEDNNTLLSTDNTAFTPAGFTPSYGLSEVTKVTKGPICSTLLTQSKVLRVISSASSATGHTKSGAARYHTANVSGNQATIRSTNRGRESEPARLVLRIVAWLPLTFAVWYL